ncbi:MAG: RRXRR domain-containing protein, partial [Lachnospiraceae bacterium]|nr:RRXRR domain-containing protein [Lachnospiraceae bacterium]
MFDVSVIDLSGQLLMSTSRVKARKLLKTGKAIIFSYLPFAIQLNYTVSNPVVQEIEVCMDTGSEHIGISVKSEKHEFLHLQAD